MLKNGVYIGYIYKITNILNGKIYIGQTSESIRRRFKRHIYDSKSKETSIARAIRKYGHENFSVEVLCVINAKTIFELDELLNKNEVEQINNLKSMGNGYNQTIGGNGVRGYKISEKRKKQLREKFEVLLKKQRLPINVYDNDGNLVKRFGSIFEASKETGFSRTAIKKCCETKKIYKTGYLFKYDDDNEFNKNEYEVGVHHSNKKIAMYTLGGNYIKTYKSIIEASRDNQINDIVIIRNCSGEFKRAGNYIFSYIDDLDKVKEKIDGLNVLSLKNLSPVVMMDKEFKVLMKFNSIKDASKFINSSSSQISDVCRGKRKTVRGYKFRYFTEEERKGE